MEIILGLCLGITLSAACGFRVFVPPLAMSLAAIYAHFPLSSGFEWLGTPEAAIALAVATLFEILAYYLPLLDNLLDTISIPLAISIGTVLTAANLTDADPVLQWTLAAIAGGGSAGIIQSLFGVSRLASTGMTGGLSNFIIATVEALGAATLSVLGFTVPWLAAAIVIGILMLAIFKSTQLLLARLQSDRGKSSNV